MSRDPLHRLAPIAFVFVVAAMLLAGCGAGASSTPVSAPTSPLITTDALGHPITIPSTAPKRIVSLDPSNSETLAALKVDSLVVGVDSYTDYPAVMAAKTKVTDESGQVNVEQIIGLNPDLVLDYSTFHQDADKLLSQAGIQVVALPSPSLDQTLTEIRLIGQLTHAYPAAVALTTSMQARITAIKQKVAKAHQTTTYMEIGDSVPPGKPYVFGGGSFGDEIIRDAGGVNVFGANTESGGYPEVSYEAVIAANPQVVILTEDPQYGGDPQQVPTRSGWSVIDAVQHHRVFAIAPALVQRPGPRIVDGLEQVAKALHPDLFS